MPWKDKNKQKEYARKRREENREEINAKFREKYAQNREKESQRKKQWRIDNPEKAKIKDREFRERNKDKLRKWEENYRETGKKKEYNKKYYQEHKGEYVMTRERKDRANENERKRRALSEEERIKHRKEATEWRKNNPLKSKAIKIRKYGITIEEFNSLLKDQGGKCAICGMSDMSNPVKFPLVDHCHTGNHVRGLLCSNCNHGLGHFKDSPALLRKSAKYLEKYALFGPISKAEGGNQCT